MKKKILIISMIIVTLFAFVGCDESDLPDSMGRHFENIVIHNRTDLYYDNETMVVYYIFCNYMSPYYSENGKLCKYDNGRIVEITEVK